MSITPIQQPRHDRRQLARDDREHRLIQALQAGDDVALVDERAALRVAGGRGEVRIVEALADRGGLACSGLRSISLAVTQLLLSDCEHDIAALDAVAVLDEPLSLQSRRR